MSWIWQRKSALGGESRGWGLLNFLWSWMPSWIESCKRPGYQSVTHGLVTRNGGIVPARICGYFLTHVQDSSKKCDKVNLIKNKKTLGTRLVVRYLFSSSLFLFKWIMNLLSDGLQKNLQNEKLKGSEKQNSTTGFTGIKVHNETNWNG